MKPKTARQTQILEFIKRFIAQNGYSPSLRTIGKEIDLSPSVILTHLENMEDSGLIERMPNSNRSIRVLGQIESNSDEIESLKNQLALYQRNHEMDLYYLKEFRSRISKDSGIYKELEKRIKNSETFLVKKEAWQTK